MILLKIFISPLATAREILQELPDKPHTLLAFPAAMRHATCVSMSGLALTEPVRRKNRLNLNTLILSCGALLQNMVAGTQFGLRQCSSTAGSRPGTGPLHQLYRTARGSPGICHFSFLSNFHD